ncbi:MAG: hypothetical protein GY862_10735, partial [Gammaproteobacteria bacterium]|nr:hypothetical protein [Gammaproteobacteria bacterium]
MLNLRYRWSILFFIGFICMPMAAAAAFVKVRPADGTGAQDPLGGNFIYYDSYSSGDCNVGGIRRPSSMWLWYKDFATYDGQSFNGNYQDNTGGAILGDDLIGTSTSENEYNAWMICDSCGLTVVYNDVPNMPVTIGDDGAGGTYGSSTCNNNAPVFDTAGITSVLEDTTYTYNITASDPDAGDTLALSAQTKPAWLSFSDGGSGSGTLTGTPTDTEVGSHSVTLRVNDGTADVDQSFTITVSDVNDAPSFTKGTNQTVNEDAGAQTAASWASNISKGSANESAQTLAFQVSNNNNALFAAQPDVATDGTLTYTPDADANGDATVTISLKDNGGIANGGVDTSANQSFTITVNSVNDAPSFSNSGDQMHPSDLTGLQTVTDWANTLVMGPANEAAQAAAAFSIIVSDPDDVLADAAPPTVSTAGLLAYTLNGAGPGIASLQVTLRDSGGIANGGTDLSAAAAFIIEAHELTLTVTPNNFGEGSGPGAASATVTRSGSTSWAQTVDLFVNDRSEAVPAVNTVTIPDGQASASFTMDAVEDISVDGPQTIILTASASTYKDGTAVITVQNNDSLRYNTLDVSITGTGTVTGTGINCGADCSEDYSDGAFRVFSASPDSGWVFDHWGGDCSAAG